MAPTRSRVTPSTLQTEALGFPERYKDVPYDQLEAAFSADGYRVVLMQTSALASFMGGALVTFDVLLGKDDSALEKIDEVTFQTGAAPGQVSLAARLMARETVTYLLTGRLSALASAALQQARPAAPQPANGVAPHEQTIDMRDQDVELPGERPLPPENEGGEYVNAAPETAPVNVVERREPDGLPIFRDLYAIGAPEVKTADEIVQAVLDEVDDFLRAAKAVEQVDALPQKNPELIKFIKDFGNDEDVRELTSMVNRRRNELARPPGAVPRRRAAAVPRAN